MDKIQDVNYSAAGNHITTCTITLESGTEVLGSAFSDTIAQLEPEAREAAYADAILQIEKSKFPFLDQLEEAYIASWEKLQNEIDQKLIKEIKNRGIKTRNVEARNEWMKGNLKINSVDKVNQVYLYPDSNDEEMLFAYDERAVIRETKDKILVEFGGIIDLKETFKGKTLADSLKEKGEEVKKESDYNRV